MVEKALLLSDATSIMLYRSATDTWLDAGDRQLGQSYIEFSFSGACGKIAATLTDVR